VRGVAWSIALGVARVAVGAALGALLACEPDYAHSAFLCKDEHGCPSGQSCMMGRCRRGTPAAPDGVKCGSAPCDPTQQCCLYSTGPSCIAASDVCPEASALCDGAEDCQLGDRCCADSDTVACDETCASYACQDKDDCPTTQPNCCHYDPTLPWGICSSQPC
jgi:hypothetical protein